MDRRFFGKKLAGVAAAAGAVLGARCVAKASGDSFVPKTWFRLREVMPVNGFDKPYNMASFYIFNGSGMHDLHYVKVVECGENLWRDDPLYVGGGIRIIGFSESVSKVYWRLDYEVRGFDNTWRPFAFNVKENEKAVLLL